VSKAAITATRAACADGDPGREPGALTRTRPGSSPVLNPRDERRHITHLYILTMK
jgi:hypothetical protein